MRTFVEKHLVLFSNTDDSKSKLPLGVSCYADAAHLVADMLKTCILALGEGRNHGMPGIPQPEVNVSGVLSLVLELLPIEEFNLLDILLEAASSEDTVQYKDDDFCIENFLLSPPPGLLN